MNGKLIEKIEEKTTQKGQPFFYVVIEGKDFSAFKGTTAFEQIKKQEIKVGDLTENDFVEKPLGNKVFRNLSEFHLIEKSKSKFNSDFKQPVSYWENKDKRITRMSCLARAVDFHIAKDSNKINLKDVIETARKLELDFVYRDD